MIAQLAAVEEQIATAQHRHAELSAVWKHQCEQNVMGAAEATEAELDKVERLLDRCLVRRDYLTKQPTEKEPA